MIKTKYDRMTKEEKKNIREKYKKTEAGSAMFARLLRLQIIGIVSFFFSIGLLGFQWDTLRITDYLLIILLFLASVLFIMMSYKLKKKVLNQFIIKNNK